MIKKNAFSRQSTITDEPMFIKPELLGLPLATPRRRATAFVFDIILWIFLSVPVLLLLWAVTLYVAHPTVYNAIKESYFKEQAPAEQKVSNAALKAELLRLFGKQKPESLSPAFQKALDSGDDGELLKITEDYSLILDLDFSDRKKSHINYVDKKIFIRPDLIFGEISFFLNLGLIFLVYFTFFPFIFKGKTPGKLLFRIKVIRLDGAPLSFWSIFGRAGGYSASFSTLGLGFLEAIWHPNRQAVHDRISGTVVIRDKVNA